MRIPYSRWYPALQTRRSYRLFDPDRAIEAEKLSALHELCEQFRPFKYARACLVTRSGDAVFTGLPGGYGKVKGAPAFVAFIGNMQGPTVQEEVGYTGEGIVLEAAAQGLDTCWVGGFFSRARVSALLEIGEHERVLAVSPVGYARRSGSLEERVMAGLGRHHRRLALAKLITRSDQPDLPEWIRISLEAARLAPSAVNRQPWNFEVRESEVTIGVRPGVPDFTISKRLDCGIAMLQFEVGAGFSGVEGKWEFLEVPQVARFRITQ